MKKVKKKVSCLYMRGGELSESNQVHSERWSEIHADSIMSKNMFVNANFLRITLDETLVEPPA